MKNIRLTSRLFVTGKKRDANFAVDPDFTQHNNDFEIWMQRLPPHLQIAYKSDGSPPWIPFHFVANLHCYHLLSVVMHHRPQIDFSPGADHDLSRQKFATCYTAATQICRLHEAVVQKSGLNGLLCMLRGINLAIYTVLTCTMLHLVSNQLAKWSVISLISSGCDYFARSRAQHDCKRLLYATYANSREMLQRVANA